MDTGEFVAIDVPDDEIRRIGKVNAERVRVLRNFISTQAHRIHNNYHAEVGGLWTDCPYMSCKGAHELLLSDGRELVTS